MVIVGRDAEIARLHEMVAHTRIGQGGAVVISGEAGIGKTALLDLVADHAEGCTVVRATGVEFESELTYAALSEIARPLREHAAELPDHHAAVFRDVVLPANVHRHTVYAATLALLTAAATVRPVICLVDDAHWVDRASAEALLFTARRLQSDAVLIVFATREIPEFAAPGIATIRLHGLDETTSRRLLPAGLPAPTAARLTALTMGNPLALLEVPRMLDLTRGANPREPLPTNQLLGRVFAAALPSMTADERLALLVCAASGHAELEVVKRALADLAMDVGALDTGVTDGLIRITGDAVLFRHPMVRSAVYAQAAPGERRRAHQALATALTAPEDADRQAWHRAHGAVGPDEDVAAALASAAQRARNRDGAAAAAVALERAAELTADRDAQAARLSAASTAWRETGAFDHAGTLLDRAEALQPDDPAIRLDLLGQRAYLMMLHGEIDFDTLVADTRRIADADPVSAGRMLSMSMNGPLSQWDVPATLDICLDVMRLISPDGPSPVFPKAAVRLALAQVLAGQPAGRALAMECVPLAETHDRDGTCSELAEVLLYTGDYPEARHMVELDIEGARLADDISLLVYALPRRALSELIAGHPLAAYSDATEAVGLAEVMGQRANASNAHAMLALVNAVLGRAEDCAGYAMEAMRPHPDNLEIEARARHALGHLALATGRFEDAARELGRVAELLAQVVEPAVVPYAPDLIEALLRLGRRADAERVLARVAGSGRPSIVLRCQALVTGDEALFQAAIDNTPEPLARARIMLAYGQWLRRIRRRQDAYVQLDGALQVFEPAGVRLWAEQTRRELDVLGMRSTRRTDYPDPGLLTAQEWRIAWAAAQGRTSREIATQVVLSVRTVDHHLGSVYRKLGIRSRRELVHRLAKSTNR